MACGYGPIGGALLSLVNALFFIINDVHAVRGAQVIATQADSTVHMNGASHTQTMEMTQFIIGNQIEKTFHDVDRERKKSRKNSSISLILSHRVWRARGSIRYIFVCFGEILVKIDQCFD